jgi:CrcB protein
MKEVMLVFIGGGLGSATRFGVSLLFKNMHYQLHAVAATFTSNILSCIILALVGAAISSGKIDSNMRYLLIIGFCSGFSTFSTFSLETLQLAKQGLWGWAMLNIVVSVASCLAVLWVLSKNETFSAT